jgi:hypothetical protein
MKTQRSPIGKLGFFITLIFIAGLLGNSALAADETTANAAKEF